MPETQSLRRIVTIGGDTYTEVTSVSAVGFEKVTPSVPAAKTGTLTTRTDNDTGTFTMAAGHGWVTGDKVDFFWTGGTRRNMTVTMTGDSAAADGGSGDNLPAATTAVTAMKPVAVDLDADGDDAVSVGVYSPRAGWVVFVDDAAAEIAAATYRLDANEGRGWVTGDGTNPLAGAVVASVKFSHADSSAAQTMRAAVGLGTA